MKKAPQTKSPDKPNLVVILGPTASGKTRLAIQLAKQFNGEIVCADSRTIYRGMDIGTSKPNAKEQRTIKHRLFDSAKPDQVVTLVAWQKRAYRTIYAIIRRGKTPFLVGGTGLYLSSIIENYQVPQKKGIPRYNFLILGMHVPREKLYKQINARVRTMVTHGLEKEITRLSKKYSWSLPAMHGIGYQEWKPYFEGIKTKQQTIAAIQQATRNFAKRQMTWFRGMERKGTHIQWVATKKQATVLVQNFIR